MTKGGPGAEHAQKTKTRPADGRGTTWRYTVTEYVVANSDFHPLPEESLVRRRIIWSNEDSSVPRILSVQIVQP